MTDEPAFGVVVNTQRPVVGAPPLPQYAPPDDEQQQVEIESADDAPKAKRSRSASK